MAQAVRFTTSASVVLNGIGYGFIRLSPVGEKWEVDRLTVKCSTNTNEARSVIYLGYIGAQYVADPGTYSGSSGDTSNTVHYLEDGQALIVEWAGGDVGATATATLAGWKSAPEGGFRAVH